MMIRTALPRSVILELTEGSLIITEVKMERKIVLKKELLDTFKKIGVKAGQTIMVHCSLSSLGFVCGGAVHFTLDFKKELSDADGKKIFL